MRKYNLSNIAFALILSLYLFIWLDSVWYCISIKCVLLFIYIVACILSFIIKDKPYIYSSILYIVHCLVFIYLFIAIICRLYFVIKFEGFDNEDGGSPMLFIINSILTILGIIPLWFVVYYGWKANVIKIK
jgi:hypothetical protein